MLFEQLNPHSCRTYLICNEKDSRVVLVDPVIEHFNDYLGILKTRNLTLTHVIDTHTHADHISGCSALMDITGCDYVMHQYAVANCVNIRVNDGDKLLLNGIEFNFLYTPGHTKDSMSIIVEDKLLTGDCLFLDDAGGGRDDLPGGDSGEHWESLKKLASLPGSLIVYPAHEYRDRLPSTLDNQRRTNPHLAGRSKEDFVRYLEDLRLGPAEWMKDVLKANYSCAKDPNAAWIPLDAPACEIKGTMDKGVNETEVAKISAADLHAKILDESVDPLILDVREEHELTGQLGHIDGILHIPIGSLAARLDELLPYKEREIIVICRSGARATTGAQILRTAGFPKVLVLDGGMIAWLNAMRGAAI